MDLPALVWARMLLTRPHPPYLVEIRSLLNPYLITVCTIFSILTQVCIKFVYILLPISVFYTIFLCFNGIIFYLHIEDGTEGVITQSYSFTLPENRTKPSVPGINKLRKIFHRKSGGQSSAHANLERVHSTPVS